MARLDHRPVQRRDGPPLGLKSLGQPLTPFQSRPEHARDPAQTTPNVAPHSQKAAAERKSSPHQRRDLLVERQQLVQPNRP